MIRKPHGTSTARLIDGRYQILEDLGSGRDGQVCLAFDLVREERLAIKWVDTRSARQAGALHDEYELGARLSHDGWPRFFERGRDGDIEYFTMEFVDGTPLHQQVSSLGLADMLSLLHQACGALGTLHALEVVHADLKPDHLLVVDGPLGPRLTLVDLSLALKPRGNPTDAPEAANAELRGTLEFASAAVLDGQRPGALDDLFALGSSFEWSLARRERMAQPGEEDAARVLKDTLRRLTSSDPDTRYRSARHAQQDISCTWPPTLRPPRRNSGSGPLVGRMDELEAFDRLLDVFQSAPTGTSTVVCGPPGSGKSRLLAEFERRARSRDLPVISLTALQGRGRARLQRELRIAHARGDERLASDLVDLERQAAGAGHASAIQDAIHTLELLRRAANARPLIVFVQLSPACPANSQALRNLWTALLELPPETPLWLLACAEPDLPNSARSTWNNQDFSTKPLSRPDADRLAAEFLTQDNPWVEARIHDHCQGHPGFTVAAARAAAHATSNGNLSLEALDRIIHDELPVTLEKSLRHELAALPTAARALAEQLVVFAIAARHGVVARYLDEDVERTSCAALAGAGLLLLAEDGDGQPTIALAESFRRVLATDLSPEDWAERNLRAHAAWGQEASSDLRALALAGHAIETGDRDLAHRQAARAADVLLDHQAAQPAFDILQRCVDEWRPVNGEDERALAPILARLGECQFRLGRLAHANHSFERATTHLTREMDRVALWSCWGEALDGMGRPEQARAKLQHALNRPASEDPKAYASACGILGRIEYRLGNAQTARDTLERGLTILKDRHPCEATASLQNDLGVLAYTAARFDEALQHHTAALRIRTGLGDQDGIARSLTNLGSIHMSRGQNIAARKNYRASLVIKRTLGNQQSIALTLSNLALLDHWLGHYASAIQGHEEALEIRTAIGATLDQQRSLTHLSRVLSEKGAFPRAMLCAERALALAERSRARDESIVHVQCARAEVLNSLGWGERARAAIDDGLRACAATDDPVGTGILHSLRAEQLLLTEAPHGDRSRRIMQELEASRDALRGVETPYVAAEALLRSSMTLLDAPDLELRLDWLEEGARIAAQLDAPGLLLKAELLRGHACISADRPTEASTHLFAALDGARALSNPDLLWRVFAGMARFQTCFGRQDRSLLWLKRCMGVFRDALHQMPDPEMQTVYLEATARKRVLDSVADWAILPAR